MLSTVLIIGTSQEAEKTVNKPWFKLILILQPYTIIQTDISVNIDSIFSFLSISYGERALTHTLCINHDNHFHHAALASDPVTVPSSLGGLF